MGTLCDDVYRVWNGSVGSVWVELETAERKDNTASSLVLQLRKSMEEFQQKIYAVQEAMEQISREDVFNIQDYKNGLVMFKRHWMFGKENRI